MMFAAAALASASIGCSDDDATFPEDETVLEEVAPAAGTTDVDPEGSITLRFSHPMGNGVEQYVDLHRGGISGPVVPMGCELSDDRSVLTCTPGQPLQSGTAYTMHIGAGMMDQNGRPAEIEEHGMGMGGQPVTDEMMGGMHGRAVHRHDGSRLGASWRRPLGHGLPVRDRVGRSQ
jgi:hypothetical protein